MTPWTCSHCTPDAPCQSVDWVLDDFPSVVEVTKPKRWTWGADMKAEDVLYEDEHEGYDDETCPFCGRDATEEYEGQAYCGGFQCGYTMQAGLDYIRERGG